MSSCKNMIAIHFSTYSITTFGETVCVVGNCAQLGMWNPQKGLKLHTNPKEYPIWFSKNPITLQQAVVQDRKLTHLEFKLCILDKEGNTLRWESLKHNRSLSLKASCSVFLTQGEPELEYDFDNSETSSTQINSTRKAPLSEIQQESDEEEPPSARQKPKLENSLNGRKRSGSSNGRNWISLDQELAFEDQSIIKL